MNPISAFILTMFGLLTTFAVGLVFIGAAVLGSIVAVFVGFITIIGFIFGKIRGN